MYLTSRSRYKDCHSYGSKKFIATFHVPQGSFLRPLFFNLYINDIVNKLENDLLLQADDLKIFEVIINLIVWIYKELRMKFKTCMENGERRKKRRGGKRR